MRWTIVGGEERGGGGSTLIGGGAAVGLSWGLVALIRWVVVIPRSPAANLFLLFTFTQNAILRRLLLMMLRSVALQ